MGIAMLRVNLQGEAETLDCLIQLSVVVQRQRQIVMIVRIVWLKPHGFCELGDCFVERSRCSEGEPQAEMGMRESRVNPDCLAILLDRVIDSLVRGQRQSQVATSDGSPWADRER